MKKKSSLEKNIIEALSKLIPNMLESIDSLDVNYDSLPDEIMILPVSNMVLFPDVVKPVEVKKTKALSLMSKVKKEKLLFGVVTQKSDQAKDSKIENLYSVGVLAGVVHKTSSNTFVVRGIKRFKIQSFQEDATFIKAKVTYLDEEQPCNEDQFKFLLKQVSKMACDLAEDSPILEDDQIQKTFKKIGNHPKILDAIINVLHKLINNYKTPDKQAILELNNLYERAERISEILKEEMHRNDLRKEILSKTRREMSQSHRTYHLQQQLRAIKEELGEQDSDDAKNLIKKAADKQWGREVQKHFDKELGRLSNYHPQMSEYSVQLNYLEQLVSLPWGAYSKDDFNLKRATRILNRDHFGMEKVKNRIIEYLAVLKLKKDMKSPIICLYGPPGVGKTSLGKSIAESLGRKYVRMSLGGLRDESEIRGHRKTYIGSMMGRILGSLKKCKTSNPVFVLDEIDKLSEGNAGNPTSAMLEVLDPEQNDSFYDNYLEIGYDLSKVLFIATANNVGDIPWALRDRMELINVSSYTTEEKIQIAKRYLLPKQLKNHGLKREHLRVPQKVLEHIVSRYTRESGVRNLEKKIAKMIRFIAKSVVMETPYEKEMTIEKCTDILGVPKVTMDICEPNDAAGVVMGLAWTAVGGDVLFIEATLAKARTNLSITGNLGKVMKESATIALEYIHTHAQRLSIKQDLLTNYKVHVHVPEGATPKDGSSAGVTMLTAMVSAFTKRKVRAKIAMSGEITLRGKVLPVGGIQEKVLAAKRAGVKTIMLCEKNRVDVEEIKPEYVKGLKFHYVKTMDEVLDFALLKEKAKIAS